MASAKCVSVDAIAERIRQVHSVYLATAMVGAIGVNG